MRNAAIDRPAIVARLWRRLWRPALLLLALALLVPGRAQEAPQAAPPGFHGMLVLGSHDRIYAVHLAMRSNPAHRFQLILEVTLDAEARGRLADSRFLDGADLADIGAGAAYLRDRAHPDNGVSVYTYRPSESFDLTEIVRGERQRLPGDIVRGHFERDAAAPTLLEGVDMVVNEIVFFQPLEGSEDGASTLSQGRLEYLLFGSSGEFFLSHRLSFHDDPADNAFHQLFRLTPEAAERLNLAATRQALTVRFDAGHATAEGRLPEAGGGFDAHLGGVIDGAEVALPLPLSLEPELYLEVLF